MSEDNFLLLDVSATLRRHESLVTFLCLLAFELAETYPTRVRPVALLGTARTICASGDLSEVLLNLWPEYDGEAGELSVLCCSQILLMPSV